MVSESYDSTITFASTTTFSADAVNPKELNLTIFGNPGSAKTPVTINFDLNEPGEVKILIYEISGRIIYSSSSDFETPGNKSIIWNGTNNIGNSVGNGVYILQVQTKEGNAAQKIIRRN